MYLRIGNVEDTILSDLFLHSLLSVCLGMILMQHPASGCILMTIQPRELLYFINNNYNVSICLARKVRDDDAFLHFNGSVQI